MKNLIRGKVAIIALICTENTNTTTKLFRSLILQKINDIDQSLVVEIITIDVEENPTTSIANATNKIVKLNPKFTLFCDFLGEIRILDLCKRCIINKVSGIVYVEKNTYNGTFLEANNIKIIPSFDGHQELTDKVVAIFSESSKKASA